ncbi:hypothetical protein LH460_03020 [Laribacter hongkongensis]|uniref:hypothetical protein n=1 Tax=Laribacter hongkongensis TaxID=168471 RepID=UPI001EFD1563|nr:hypothetical protein [Laribacter hongkongensis]MCG9123656.1 hypothetical protein [Laribacter hongkongensis]
MPLLALKVDVHTRHGLLHGVPKLAELLAAAGASATFCLNVGPDRAGRVPAAEWLAKDSFKLHRQLPWSTRMAGRWWPGRQPGRAGRQVCQQLQAAGFELALAAWDQAAWRQEALTGEAEWSRKTLEHARTAFSKLTGQPAAGIASPGWRINWPTVRELQQQGFAWASDTRGSRPFIPVHHAEIVAVPQLPTTLPTLDEVLADIGNDEAHAAERLLGLSARVPAGGCHVYTLAAEREGGAFAAVFEALLAGWQEQGWQLVSLGELAASLDMDSLPRCNLKWEAWPRRPGERTQQGDPAFAG